MSKTDVVCIPFHDIKMAQVEGFRTRDAHLYRYFAKHASIEKTVIFNRPTMLLELALKRKRLKTAGELIFAQNNVYITRIENNLFAVDILDFEIVKPVLRGKGFIPDLYLRNLSKFNKALEFLEVEDFFTYESSPLTAPLCEKLKSKHRVFDGVDNLCKHTTYAPFHDLIQSIYRKIISDYPSVFFNSMDSIKYFSAENKANVEFLPNGVDFDFFRGQPALPALMASFNSPVVLYAGKMQEMLDVELVKDCASRLPHATFLLLGKVLSGDIKSKLSSVSNVIFTGDIKYESLPAYVCNADVCFIPYRVDRQHGGDPIKFYEFMAANKRVISTPIGEVYKYHNGTHTIVCERDIFVDQLEKLLEHDENINNILPQEMTWNYKASYMVEKVGVL